ncbi:MAG TPA: response regulator [Syntrophobacteria bacterium]|nr:response regulator [Syntrophobacteria bacterium]
MGEKILVVDDEQSIREWLKTALEMHGYEIILAANGEEAIRLAASDSPHLIILDAVMPELDGIDTCIALRANEKTRAIPIILATGFAEVLAAAVNAGVDDFLTKPFDLDRLMIRVRSMLRVRHLEDELERAVAYMQALKDKKSRSPEQ